MMETGLLHKLEKKYKVPDECRQKAEEKTNAHPLSIHEVAAVFVIIGVGVSFSCIILLAEISWTTLRIKIQ